MCQYSIGDFHYPDIEVDNDIDQHEDSLGVYLHSTGAVGLLMTYKAHLLKRKS